MVKDAVQTAVHLASGLTKTTRERAAAAARVLIGHAGLEDVASEAQDRVGRLADEIVSASKANTQLLTSFVTHEVDQAVERLGLARRSDLEDLRNEISSLRAALADLSTQASTGGAETPPAGAAARRTASRATKTSPAAPARRTATATTVKAPTAAKARPAQASPAKAPSATAPALDSDLGAAAPAKRARKTTRSSPAGAGATTDPAAEPAAAATGPAATGGVVGPFEPEPLPVPDPIPAAQPDEGVGGARPEDSL